MSPSLVTDHHYQHIVVTGTPFERGIQHGQQACDKIHFNIAQYKVARSMPSFDVVQHYAREYYLPALASEFPRGLEEMRGIAEGAKVHVEDIIMLNARYDLSRLTRRANGPAAPAECTSMSLVIEPFGSADTRVYVAQNWDINAWLRDNDTIIVLESVDPSADDVTAPRSTIMLTEAGQLGRSGMNSLGMAACANSLWSSQDYFPSTQSAKSKPFLPISVARRLFLEHGNIGDALAKLWRIPRHTSNNMMLGCKSGINLNVELTPGDRFVSQPETLQTPAGTMRLLTHANHFASAEMLSRPDIKDEGGCGSSYFRHARLSQRLHRTAAESGKLLGIKDIKEAFTDHASYPQSLCEHASPTSSSVTVACVVYDVDRLEMHVSTGNPCQGNWAVYRLGR